MEKKERTIMEDWKQGKVKTFFSIKEPDGKMGIALARIDTSEFTNEEKQYLQYSDLDYMEVYYLIGGEDYDEEIYGKKVLHRTVTYMLNDLSNLREETKSNEIKKEIEELIDEIKILIEEVNKEI